MTEKKKEPSSSFTTGWYSFDGIHMKKDTKCDVPDCENGPDCGGCCNHKPDWSKGICLDCGAELDVGAYTDWIYETNRDKD